MQRALTLTQSTVGQKAIMAASGVILFGFVFFHMLGNLQLYEGAGPYNAYSAFLHRTPEILWTARVVLLGAIVAHIASAFALWSRNADARTRPYRRRKDRATNYAARTMYWTGPILFMFIIYHLAHLTFDRAPYPMVEGDVFDNVVHGFEVWWISAFYIVGNLCLGFHLFHGVYAMFSSVGLVHPKYERARRTFAIAFAVAIAAGNVSFPLAVMSGLVEPSTVTAHTVVVDPGANPVNPGANPVNPGANPAE